MPTERSPTGYVGLTPSYFTVVVPRMLPGTITDRSLCPLEGLVYSVPNLSTTKCVTRPFGLWRSLFMSFLVSFIPGRSPSVYKFPFNSAEE